MSRKRKAGTKLPREIRERLDALAEVLREPGREPNQNDAIMATIHAGLDAIERDPSVLLRLAAKAGPKKSDE